jgi:hypothetical protein
VIPAGNGAWHDVRVAQWVEFHRSDAGAVIAMVRAVADARDPGEHGDGVEVVIEAPRHSWLKGLFNRDDQQAQARIVVTRAGGEVGYPFDIQLVTAYGGRAAHRVGSRPGWAVSDSAGLAFLIQKGRPGARFEFGALVGGAVLALTKLRRGPVEKGWRATVDRSVKRA